MSILSTKRAEESPIATRVNTSLGNSIFSPNKTVKLAESHYCKTSRSKNLQYGSTWKMFVLPEFRANDLGQSISTIPTPHSKKDLKLRLPPMNKQKDKVKERQQNKFGSSSIENRSLNQILQSHIIEPERESLGTTYMREEVEYLRTEFSEVLRKKYRPNCKTLYD